MPKLINDVHNPNMFCANIIENIVEGVMVLDLNKDIIFINPAFTNITEYSMQDVIGNNAKIFSAGKHDHYFFQELWLHVERFGVWRGEIWTLKKSGNVFLSEINITSVKDKDEKTLYYVCLFQDITEKKRLENCIKHTAYHDYLTGLPNRLYLHEQLLTSLEIAQKECSKLAVLFIDLDRFKRINDTFGHSFGDRILKLVSERISESLRTHDFLSRFGGDEFVVILNKILERKEASLIAERIRKDLLLPFTIDGQEFVIGASIGISLFPDDGFDIDALVNKADYAMYRVKESGRNNTLEFTSNEPQYEANKFQLESHLYYAIDRKELEVYYQPQYNRNGIVIGVEALVRWNHPNLGIVSPSEFIPIAENSGMIYKIDEWVIRNACDQCVKWMKEGYSSFHLSVNVSMLHFQREDFIQKIDEILFETEFPANLLNIELTESIMSHNPDRTINMLNLLRQRGIQISLDDFGIGYSSLSILKHFPINYLKIDRSFVKNLENEKEHAITRAIIDMAKSLQLQVVAEGIETEEHLNILHRLGCHEFQGYYYGKPMPAQEVIKSIKINH